MDPYKAGRLSASIQRVLGELLQHSVKDPRVALVTIASVELNRDGSVAKVYFQTPADGEERARGEQGLQRARPFLQRRVGQILRLRNTPELRFLPDDTLERGFGVDAVLRELSDRGEFVDERERLRRLFLGDFVPPAELLDGLRAGRRFWLCPHWSPDPDAMGSALALRDALRQLGRDADVLLPSEAPSSFAALPGFDQVLDPAAVGQRAAGGELPDTLVMVDCHRRDRAGDALTDLLAPIPNALTIDHHLISGRRLPLPGWVDSAAPSTSLLVYRVIEELARATEETDARVQLDLDMATNIYAGLVNDTGGFRFSNTLPVAFELAQRLVAAGVDPADIAERTLHRRSRQAMDLLQRLLAAAGYYAGGRILVLRADREALAASGATLPETEGLIGLASSLEGVAFVAFLKQIGDAQWRVSLRAPGGGDVQAIAARFGGGGHRPAAGCTIEGDAAEVERLIVDALLETL